MWSNHQSKLTRELLYHAFHVPYDSQIKKTRSDNGSKDNDTRLPIVGRIVKKVRSRRLNIDHDQVWRVAFDDDVERILPERRFRRTICGDIDLVATAAGFRTVIIKVNNHNAANSNVNEQDEPLDDDDEQKDHVNNDIDDEAIKEEEHNMDMTCSISSMSSSCAENEQHVTVVAAAADVTPHSDAKQMVTEEDTAYKTTSPTTADRAIQKNVDNTICTKTKVNRKKAKKSGVATTKVKERVERVPMKTGVLYIYRYGLHPRVEFVRRL